MTGATAFCATSATPRSTSSCRAATSRAIRSSPRAARSTTWRRPATRPVFRISAPEPWRVLRAKRWAGERDIVMPRSELVGAGVVTSSSGVTSYRGAAYREKYRGNVFVCECAGNLLYRLGLTPDGPTFKATRIDGQAEMVASTDNW